MPAEVNGRPGGRLRVHGGEAGGRRLAAPRGMRPTQGLVKEAIFNIVGAAVADAIVLDLFAGSGALALEALSRGAARAVLVDRDEAAVRAARHNLALLGYQDVGTVVRDEVTRWLEAHPERVAGSSLVLLDPPYNDPVLERTLALLDRLCGAGSTVVAEHDLRQPLPGGAARLRAERQRRYGGTLVTVLRV